MPLHGSEERLRVAGGIDHDVGVDAVEVGPLVERQKGSGATRSRQTLTACRSCDAVTCPAPAATARRSATAPMIPVPSTQTDCPGWISAAPTPQRAITPSCTKAASPSGTPGGTRWAADVVTTDAWPTGAATRSPTARPERRPAATTTPAAE